MSFRITSPLINFHSSNAWEIIHCCVEPPNVMDRSTVGIDGNFFCSHPLCFNFYELQFLMPPASSSASKTFKMWLLIRLGFLGLWVHIIDSSLCSCPDNYCKFFWFGNSLAFVLQVHVSATRVRILVAGDRRVLWLQLPSCHWYPFLFCCLSCSNILLAEYCIFLLFRRLSILFFQQYPNTVWVKIVIRRYFSECRFWWLIILGFQRRFFIGFLHAKTNMVYYTSNHSW